MTGQCPRDSSALRAGTGALAEDVCSRCHGRFLDSSATHRLFVEILGIRADLLVELARAGTPRADCPGCGFRMFEVRARGVLVDLCPGCGACWLDGGELARLARDVVEEIRVGGDAAGAAFAASLDSASAHGDGVTSGLELDLSPRPALASLRFEVCCVNCDEPLDLGKVNWLINTRPWCPPCARPYSSVLSMFSGSAALSFFLGLLGRSMWWRLSHVMSTSASWDRSPDVLRIAPADAERFFASFFQRAR